MLSVQKPKCFYVARYAVELGKKAIRRSVQPGTPWAGADLDGFVLQERGDREGWLPATGCRQKRGRQTDEALDK